MSAYYEALGLTREQVCRDPNCVKSAYRKLALQVHPDKQGMGTSEDFQKISRAYQVLSDPQLRAVVEMFPCLPGEPEELLQQAHAMFPGMDTETALGLLKIFLPEPSKLDSMTLGQLSCAILTNLLKQNEWICFKIISGCMYLLFLIHLYLTLRYVGFRGFFPTKFPADEWNGSGRILLPGWISR